MPYWLVACCPIKRYFCGSRSVPSPIRKDPLIVGWNEYPIISPYLTIIHIKLYNIYIYCIILYLRCHTAWLFTLPMFDGSTPGSHVWVPPPSAIFEIDAPRIHQLLTFLAAGVHLSCHFLIKLSGTARIYHTYTLQSRASQISNISQY